MTFAEKLIELRDIKNMTQQTLATESGIPLWTLRKYEQGVIEKVPFPNVVAIAKALSVSLDVFADCEFTKAVKE